MNHDVVLGKRDRCGWIGKVDRWKNNFVKEKEIEEKVSAYRFYAIQFYSV